MKTTAAASMGPGSGVRCSGAGVLLLLLLLLLLEVCSIGAVSVAAMEEEEEGAAADGALALDADAAEELLRQFEVQRRIMTDPEMEQQQKRYFYSDKYIYGDLCRKFIAKHRGKDPCLPNGTCDDSEGVTRCVCRDTRTGGHRCQFRDVCKRNRCPSHLDMCIPTSSPSSSLGRHCFSL